MVRPCLQIALGEVIRSKRKERGFSQEELAARVGIHRTYIGSVERGERNISLSNIVRIAETLETTPSALLGEAETLPRRRGERA